MAELISLVIMLLLVVLVLMPVLTFLRLGRLSRDLDDLADRVAALERASARQQSTAAAPTPAATSRTDTAATTRDSAAPVEPAPAAPVASLALPVEPRYTLDGGAAVSDSGAAAHVTATAATEEDDVPVGLEERIGSRGLLYTGVLVLFIGIGFFLKYTFDNAWIDERARIVLGAIAGLTLVGSGWRISTRGLSAFGQALSGTGFAVLYLVVYAALDFYGLIGAGTAFVLMAVITIAGAVTADRFASQPLAFIAVAGGLLTPALAGGPARSMLTLFTYVAMLVLGTLVLSLRHQWAGLNLLSYLGTLVTVFVWATRYYTSDQWLRMLLFLTLFCVSFLLILRAMRQQGAPAWRLVYGILFTAPLFYHLAAVVITAAHPPAIHIYLIAFTVVGLWFSVEPHRPMLRLALLIAAFAPLFGAFTLPSGASWLLPNVITIAAVALLHVIALIDRAVRQEQPLAGGDLLVLHASGLGLFALLHEALTPFYPGLRGALALLVAAGAAALAWRLRPRDEIAAWNGVALALTLVAIGIAVQFDGAPVVIGWAAEGAGAVWIGARARRMAFQLGGVALWAMAAFRLLERFGDDPPAALTVLLNARSLAALFVVACGYVMTWRLAGGASPPLRVAVHVIASVLTLGWMTSEIQAFWALRADAPYAHLYEQMLLSLAWGVYGAILVVAGMRRRYAPLRYIGITILAAASLKVFFYDLWELGGIYRVIGFIGFGVLLVLVSYLYQRRRPRDAASEPSAPASSATPPVTEGAGGPPPDAAGYGSVPSEDTR